MMFSDFLRNLSQKYGAKRASSIYRKGWVHYSYNEVIALALEIKSQLQNLGVKKADKVAVIMDSSPEYAATFMATSLLGCPAVLIDSKLSGKEMSEIVKHSDAVLIISGFQSLKSSLAAANIVAEEFPVLNIENLKGQLELVSAGLEQSYGIQESDLAVLVYTSGTTSNPKGVMVTWGSLLFNASSVTTAVGVASGTKLLSVLPMNHLLEFTCGFILPLLGGHSTAYANSMLPHDIVDRLGQDQYTDMIVVPLFLRTLRKVLARQVKSRLLTNLYFRFSYILSGVIPSYQMRRFIFRPVLKRLGHLQRFISGGAPLDAKVQVFFERLGIRVFQGYGLTETAPVAAVARPQKGRPGSVGLAIPNTEIKTDPATQEVLVRGPHVMLGYYKQPEMTKAVIDQEGWFHTGDLGFMTNEGYLVISGRGKDLIVLGSGKKVYPDEVEEVIADSEQFKEVSIVGATATEGSLKNNEVVCAVVVPSEELLELRKGDFDLQKIVEQEVNRLCRNMAQYKKPNKIIISTQELPKTSTRKNKRILIRKMIESGDLK